MDASRSDSNNITLNKETITTSSGRQFTRVVVDRELCIGAASCIAVAPDVYELDNDAKAIIKPEWLTVDDETLKASAESCPTLAIFLYNKDGKKVYPEN
ncbi:ferredoxin [Candidatus Uhrbacteria bacterium]|nr:ferredoxin [Candidatus Uhrbacteria bacterium]